MSDLDKVRQKVEEDTTELATPRDWIILPSGKVTIGECAETLFQRIAPTHRMFVRGGVVVTKVEGDEATPVLEPLRPSAARSFFEKFGKLFSWRSGGTLGMVLKPSICSKEMAEA